MASDVISAIQTVLAVGAFVFAYQEFKKWRAELLGSKKIELAIKLGLTAFEVRKAFAQARPFMSYSKKAPEYRPNSTPEEMKHQDRAYEMNELLRPVLEKLRQLEAIAWEVSVLFGDDDHIDSQIIAYNQKLMELGRAMLIRLDGRPTEKENSILSGDPGGDDFSKGVDTITEQLLGVARKYTQ